MTTNTNTPKLEITDKELSDPVYMRAYLEELFSELRRLHAENERLIQLIAYQGMDDTAAQLLATNSGSDSKQ